MLSIVKEQKLNGKKVKIAQWKLLKRNKKTKKPDRPEL